ncbi:Methionine--tRNA ligase [Candidatus Anstonella stagnisolia]|nr:Methionine--tRNA ligase [Candidatus Anstonella stagnisolia]
MAKKILITSALPYVNNVPHLGNIIGCVLSADVFARYCRSRKYECTYICGTDEYGTATETAALEEGVTPKELCDKYYKIHKRIYEWFGISTDIFGRTTTPQHTKITQEIFLDLYNNGYVKEDEIEQAYDEKAKMFLADRFIEGTCPHCKSTGARADQCDKCGKLLNFNELIEPRSKITGTRPIVRKTKHLFIDLPGIESELSAWIEKAAKEGEWSENSYHIAKAWLAEGLKKRCITRDLKWGVPVPLKGWENKVFYVWFDAPIGYISITANLTDKWKEWWCAPEKVHLYQFMGKDNVPFHAVIFPSTLMGTGKKWTLVHHIATTEFLNYEGGKFSKSKKLGVFGNDAVESGIPADVWRYYLLTNRPEKMDTDFSWEDFGEKLNNELLANIGNLVNRVMVFSQREFEGKVPKGKVRKEDEEFVGSQKEKFERITQLLEKVQIKEALHVAMSAGKEANAYFQKNKPWETAKTSREDCESAIYVLLHQVKDLAIVLEPYLPNTSAGIFEQLNVKQEKWDGIGKLSLKAGHKLGEPKILFKKIEAAEISKFKAKYSGRQFIATDEQKKQTVSAKPHGQKQQPEKAQAGKTAVDAKTPKPEVAVAPINASDLDLEVGKILSVERHPNAEKLYVEKILLGDGEKQIVSGLVPYISAEELTGKSVIIVKNLKAAVLRGVQSQGMLLAAQNEKHELEVVSPPNAKPGDKVKVEGEEGKAAGEISFDQFLTVKLEAKNHEAFANGKALLVNGKKIRLSKVKDGKIS